MSGGDDDAAMAATAVPARRRSWRAPVRDLAVLASVGLLLAGAIVAGGASVYRAFYSPTAFVLHYLGLLAEGRAADALALPGVAIDPDTLTAKGLPADASEALLRGAALGDLQNIVAESEVTEGELMRVTASYTAGGHPGRTTFSVRRDGTAGIAPAWRFDTSPLAIVDLTVLGSTTFRVNGFAVDKRQLTDAASEDPTQPLPLLVFSPGIYSVTIKTPVVTSDGVAVLANVPSADVPVTVQGRPTPEFVATVTERVTQFLSACATQQVLQPTGCPFGYVVYNRIEGLPTWSIAQQPELTVVPEGANWRIPETPATAHIAVDIRSLSNGALHHVDEDVPFLFTGTITTQPDGSLTIRIGGASRAAPHAPATATR